MARVLVVDDDAVNREILRLHLGRNGHTVLEADNGEQGIAALRSLRPDLVILDVIMPEADGSEVFRVLRRDPRTQNIPVMMLSIRDPYMEELPGWEFGADVYITKPYDPVHLTQTVERLLSVKQAKSA